MGDIRCGQSPCWQVGTGENLQVRRKGWLRHSKKQPAKDVLEFGSMYECLSCDGIKSTGPIRDIIGRLVSLAQLPPFDGVSSLKWTEECPLPRILCINLMLPYSGADSDPGCSYVCFFHIRPELLPCCGRAVCRHVFVCLKSSVEVQGAHLWTQRTRIDPWICVETRQRKRTWILGS